MDASLPLQSAGFLPTLIIGLSLIAVGLAFAVRPELTVAPLGSNTESVSNAVRLWGRIVATLFLLVGGLLTYIAVWNYQYV